MLLCLALCASAVTPPAAPWRDWLAAETDALSFGRTRAELREFENRCQSVGTALEPVAAAHASLSRVVVLDVRHDWNGLGDNLERYVMALRVGRALRRATFLLFDGCAAPGAPPRSDALPPGVVRGGGPRSSRRDGHRCAFDPGAHVAGLGRLSWRWTDAAARRAAEAQAAARPGESGDFPAAAAQAAEAPAELALRYSCLRFVMFTGCTHARLLFLSNGSVAAESVAPNAGEDPASFVATALWPGYLGSAALARVPLLRIELSDQKDCEDASRLPWAVSAAGHNPADPAAVGSWRGGAHGDEVSGGGGARYGAPSAAAPRLLRTDLRCETWAAWRPRPPLWRALRPALAAMEPWGGGLVALLARTGGADHLGAAAAAALAPPTRAERLAGRRAGVAGFGLALGRLFEPCGGEGAAALGPRQRFAPAGGAPCATWDDALRASGKGRAHPPASGDVAGCAGGSAATAPAHAAAAALVNASLAAAPGPLGAFLGCAFAAAAATAANDPGGGPPYGPPGHGVLLFSDAPALKCLLEGVAAEVAAAAAAPAGNGSDSGSSSTPPFAAVTPSFPGHVQYAPDGVLPRVSLAALVDHYLLGLVDVSLPLTNSAFVGTAALRCLLPVRPPPGLAAGWPPPAFAPACERWFAAGRENVQGGAGVNVSTLRLLTTTAGGRCPVTRRSVAVAAAAYARDAAAHGSRPGPEGAGAAAGGG